MPISIKSDAINVRNGQAFDPLSAFFLGDIRGEVGAWMSAHPSEISYGDYVTPEDYGAAGDGVTDDTLAWQSAVDSGKNVFAHSKTYKCGTIAVTKNISIDCNGASFVCTANTLFDLHGTLTATLTGQTDYTFNQAGYQITGTHSDYTGFAMLQGTNRFDLSRSYYYGGFVCTFRGGVMDGSYPVDVTNGSNNTTILLINPITATLRNIGNVIHTADGYSHSVTITYGYGCVVDGVAVDQFSSYAFLWLKSCLCCICKNVKISGEYGTTGTNSYAVGFIDSSYCVLKDSHIYNRYWHCCTTGGNYLCYRNSVENCVLMSKTGYACDDHENGIGTSICCCAVSGIVLGQQSTVENVVVPSMNDSSKSCIVLVQAATDNRYESATLSNIRFSPDSNCTSCGIKLETYPQNTEETHTYYFDNISVDNVRCDNPDVTCKLWCGTGATTKHYSIGKIRLNNCDMTVDLSNTSSQYVDTTNMDVKKAVYEAVT